MEHTSKSAENQLSKGRYNSVGHIQMLLSLRQGRSEGEGGPGVPVTPPL